MKPRFVDSFLYAAQGIRTAVREERNMRFHLCAAFYVYLFSLFYGFGKTEYILITLMVCGVLDVAAFRRMFAFFAARPLLAVLLAASLAVAWQFIFGKRKEGK